MCQSEQFGCLSVFVCLPADFTPPSLPLNIPNIFYLPSSLPGRPSPSHSPSLSLSSIISIITVSLHPSSSILSSTNPASRNSVRSRVFAHSTRRVKLLVQSNLVLSVGNTCHVSLSINTDNAKLHCRGHS